MIVKFCGLKRAADIEAVNRIRPDLVGFVMVPGRRRSVEPDEVAKMRSHLAPEIKVVGVFVDEEISVVKDLLNRGIIDIAQLHGEESNGYIRELREAAGAGGDPRWCGGERAVPKIRIIKAFGIRSEADLRTVEESEADLVLLDSPGGGTGETFNWRLLKEVKRPYILAGGLNAENIEEAVRMLDPFGVDVSSGIETDGVKDEKKMRAFMEAAGRR